MTVPTKRAEAIASQRKHLRIGHDEAKRQQGEHVDQQNGASMAEASAQQATMQMPAIGMEGGSTFPEPTMITADMSASGKDQQRQQQPHGCRSFGRPTMLTAASVNPGNRSRRRP